MALSKEGRLKLFAMLSLSFAYIIFWYLALVQLLPWANWIIPHWFETALGQKISFSLHFLPLITIGLFAEIVALCYFAASVGKIIIIIRDKRNIPRVKKKR